MMLHLDIAFEDLVAGVARSVERVDAADRRGHWGIRAASAPQRTAAAPHTRIHSDRRQGRPAYSLSPTDLAAGSRPKT